MSKFDNLLLLLNLLLNRRSVSSKEIVECCGISMRTAFRYLRAIDAAGFPIYYDSDVGAYRLTDKAVKGLLFTASDLVLLRIALESLEAKISPLSLPAFRRLRAKIDSILPPQRDLRDGLTKSECGQIPSDLIQQTLLTLIDFNRDSNKKTRLLLSSELGESSTLELEDPVIEFDGQWLVKSQNDKNGSIPVPLSKIRDIG